MSTATNIRLFQCNCGAELPLRPARADEPVLMWSCQRCEQVYQGATLKIVPAKTRKRMVLVEARVFPEDLPSVSHLDSVARDIDDDNREENRTAMVTPVTALMLDENQQPYGKPIPMMARDISTSGMGLVCDNPVGCEQVLVIIRKPHGPALQLITEIVWQRPQGKAWIIGGKFLQRLRQPSKKKRS